MSGNSGKRSVVVLDEFEKMDREAQDGLLGPLQNGGCGLCCRPQGPCLADGREAACFPGCFRLVCKQIIIYYNLLMR